MASLHIGKGDNGYDISLDDGSGCCSMLTPERFDGRYINVQSFKLSRNNIQQIILAFQEVLDVENELAAKHQLNEGK